MGAWSFFGALAAAIIAALFLRELKISEFRQNWINGLRNDIGEYLSEARMSMFKRTEPFAAAIPEQYSSAEDPRHAHQAYETLCRIKLSFNPRDSTTREEDDQFLKSLENLINNPPQERNKWQHNADESVNLAREILKREWEITKKPWLRYWRSLRSLCARW